MAGGAECSAHGCGHERVHGDEADGECSKPHKPARGTAEVRGEEEERELTWCFRADAVQYADEEDGLTVVHPLKARGARGFAIPEPAYTPGDPDDAVDGDGETAFDAGM